MRFAWGAVFAIAAAGAAWAEDDDDKKPAPSRPIDEEAFRDFEERLRAVEKSLVKPQDKPKEAPPAQQTWDPSKMLSFSTPDGNFTAKVGGRVYFVAAHRFELDDQYGTASETSGDLRRDNFVVDTARIQLDGSFFKDFVYRLEYAAEKNAAASNNDVFIGWVGMQDYFSLMAGQFKVPFSQEETTSSRFIDFAERSLVNRLAPGRDQGMMLHGAFADKIFEWAAGVFNGSGKNLPDTNDEYDAALRLFVTPFRTGGPDVLKHFRIGVDATIGDQDGPVAPGDITAGDVFPDTIIDFNGAALADGLRTRTTLNFSWLYGPVSLRAEYMVVNQELVDAAPESDFDITAYYLQATWLLTGETKPLENRVKPASMFDPLEGTWGAFELAARVAMIDASDGEDAGVINVGVNQKARELTIGINWWWSPNVALRINWEHYTFDEDLPGLKKGDEADDSLDVFYVRWQIDF
jgi:phosphate-selective porin OprO/OprP